MMRIDFEDGLMTVMDGQNQGHDCLDLSDCSLEYAEAQIDRWAAEYAIDATSAKQELAEYFQALDAE
jgi:hypothetical protein